MALPQLLCGALLFAHVAHILPMQFVCRGQACYSVFWGGMRFLSARRACIRINGDLMTVKDSVQAEALGILTANMDDKTLLWIGLQQPERRICTDLSQPLRGYTWVTGGSDSNYSNWRTDEKRCGTLCAAVRKDGTWGEYACNAFYGYVCQTSYSFGCNPLIIPKEYEVAYYYSDFGFAGIGGSFYPPDTRANISTFKDSLFCEGKINQNGIWSRDQPGAWNCMIKNGGCEYKCYNICGTPQCKCPPGSHLKEDKRTCADSCHSNPCSQLCYPIADPPGFLCMCSEGYRMTEDKRTCAKTDEGAVNSNLYEEHYTYTIGGCKPGFEKVDEKCQDIDECATVLCEQGCVNYPGNYTCVCNEGLVIDENNPLKCKQFCNTSPCKAECHDAKKRCQCPEGYVLNEHASGDPICTAIEKNCTQA